MTRLADIPIIDVAPLASDNRKAKLKVAAQIDHACRGLGFFYAQGHGIDIGRFQREVSCFHRTITEQEKFRLAINAYNPANSHVRNGYYMAIEGKKAVESFCYLNPSFTDEHPAIQERLPLHESNWWPDQSAHPAFQAYCEEYYRDILQLSRTLLRGFALCLQRNEDFFDPHVTLGDTLSAVSLIRYPFLEFYPPVQEAPDGTRLSFGDHKDVSIITVLFQTPVPNLQVEGKGEWLDLPVSADNFLVNCGTYMSHVTNGYFSAPVHRVKWVNSERLSLPFFVHASNDTFLEPFHPCDIQQGGGNAPIRYGEYLQCGLGDLIRKNGQT